ncbi:hypothetical protein PCANC_26531 [Puccinia coronata f. sp. avenae]|uniref:Uncharacterized protein n=1 Tax=Puccinia coronata f. sp. avenae TaxID=200324 RepID=A0A2N5TZ83_9BASI|nr:hypothetical protein PCANC_26531 [Puccinia coronata f. sp. avenae]
MWSHGTAVLRGPKLKAEAAWGWGSVNEGLKLCGRRRIKSGFKHLEFPKFSKEKKITLSVLRNDSLRVLKDNIKFLAIWTKVLKDIGEVGA